MTNPEATDYRLHASSMGRVDSVLPELAIRYRWRLPIARDGASSGAGRTGV